MTQISKTWGKIQIYRFKKFSKPQDRNTKKTTSVYIIVKFLRKKDKDKILKAAREKITYYTEGNNNKN